MLTDLELILLCVFLFGAGVVVGQFVHIRVNIRKRFHVAKEES